MGGFARYPWPQFIDNAPFTYSKYYKRHALFTVAAGLVNFLWIHRYFAFHSVNRFLVS